MRKISIDLPDEMYIELARIKYEKMLENKQIAIGDLIRQAIREWLERQKSEEPENESDKEKKPSE